MACAAALGAIETMAAEDLAGRARRIGDIMLPRLHGLAEKYPVIADVRRRGAMLAIELTRPGTLDPDPATTAAIARACHQAGLVTLTCGTFGNVIRFLPPLVHPAPRHGRRGRAVIPDGHQGRGGHSCGPRRGAAMAGRVGPQDSQGRD